jgi:aromatic-L-amino-acid decarboxylase
MEARLSEQSNYHMSSEQFRKYGYAMIDWISSYYESIEKFPVLSRVEPGAIRSMLPVEAPRTPEAFDQVLRDVEQIILPGITHWQSPNFYAYFPANASGPAMLGDLLSSALGVQGMLWATSPACTELESHVLDWLVPMMGLPAKFLSSSTGGGVIQDTASSATLCAMIAARERSTANRSNHTGCDGKLVAYTSTQAHSSIEKAAMIAGIGRDNVRLVQVDERFAMAPQALAGAIREDRAAGRIPFFVSATVGTTSSHAMDPLSQIAPVCAEHDLWFHVDAAMAGTAALCPEFRELQVGVEHADSYCFNPHKWMFTNFDCDCFFVADRQVLIRSLSILPEYLRNQATDSGAVFDYRDWQVPLGRRFRSLKLWFVLRHYGIEGLQHHIRKHVQLAQQFRNWVENDDQFEIVVPPPLNLICFRYRGSDEQNQRLMEVLNASGELYLTHTRLADRFVLRLCVGQTNTEAKHVEAAWRHIQKAASEL